jgi:hypothetical protein
MAPIVRKIVSLPQDAMKSIARRRIKEFAKRQIAMFIVSPRDLRFLTSASGAIDIETYLEVLLHR